MTTYNSEDYANYRLQRSRETVREVELLIENEFWNAAINRMYYASFYAVGALLVQKGIETSSHSGARLKFGQLFVKTGLIDRSLGKHYSDLFEKRHKGDYNDFFDHDEDTVLRLFPKTKELIDKIDLLIQNK